MPWMALLLELLQGLAPVFLWFVERPVLASLLLLARSPRRDPRAGDFGPYLPVDMATSRLVPADHETGYQLNNSQGYINGDFS